MPSIAETAPGFDPGLGSDQSQTIINPKGSTVYQDYSFHDTPGLSYNFYPLVMWVVAAGTVMLIVWFFLSPKWEKEKREAKEKKEAAQARKKQKLEQAEADAKAKKEEEEKVIALEKEKKEREYQEGVLSAAKLKEEQAKSEAQNLINKAIAETKKILGNRVPFDEKTVLVGLDLMDRVKPSRGWYLLGWLIDTIERSGQTSIYMSVIKTLQREAHFYIVGATKMGKTKFIESLIHQDIEGRAGLAVIDPHGDLVDDIKIYLADIWGPKDQDLKAGDGPPKVKEAIKNAKRLTSDVVLIDPNDPEKTASFNPLELVPGVDSVTVASELTAIIKKIWEDSSWGPRLEDLLRSACVALAESGLTLADLPDFFRVADFRARAMERVKNEIVLNSLRDYDNSSQAAQITASAPVLNKINALLLNPKLQQFFSSPHSSFNIREIMDSGKILLVKLPVGSFPGADELLGSLLMAKIEGAAFSRRSLPRNKRKPFYLYIDEFQNFATNQFRKTLAEATKFGLYLVLAHQNLSQLETDLQDAILSNTDVQIYFRTSQKDAQILARESGEKPIQKAYPDWEERRKKHKETYGRDLRREDLHFSSFDLKYQRWGERSQSLQDLKPQQFILKLKNNEVQEGAQLVRTDNLTDPLEGMSEAEVKKFKNTADSLVGFAHMRKRKDLLAESRERSAIHTERTEPEDFWV